MLRSSNFWVGAVSAVVAMYAYNRWAAKKAAS
jgi:hypothetical protein